MTYQGVILKHFIPQEDFIICYDNDFKDYRWRYVAHTFLRYKSKTLSPSKKYLLVFDNYSGPKGFAHWLSDGLTRLAEVADIIGNYTILAPEYFKNEHIYLATLAHFNVKEIEFIPEGHFVKVKQLFAVSKIAHSGDFVPENVFKLRDFIWKKINVPATKGMGPRIYISRAKASRRFVENEAEVLNVLNRYNFITVYMEDYPFDKQVEIIYHSSALVAIHGAALSLEHFMQPGASVLEFRRKGDGKNCHFYSLADALGLNYYYLFCKTTEISPAANNFNLYVDVVALEHTVKQMLGA